MDESTKLVAAAATVLVGACTAVAAGAVPRGVLWVFAGAFIVTLGFGLWHLVYTTLNIERRAKRLEQKLDALQTKFTVAGS